MTSEDIKEQDRGRSLHWTVEEAQAAGDVAKRECIHSVPVNVFCGKCED